MARKITRKDLKMKKENKKSNYIICAKCGKRITNGQSWDHEVKGDLDYHLDCYLGKHTISTQNEREKYLNAVSKGVKKE